MRIDPQNQTPASSGTGGVENSQSGQAKGLQKSASNGPSDTVQLSSGQATVRQLVSQLGQVPDVRQGQVNSLRSAISSGKYKPSNDQVASALAEQLFGISK
jgi:flagellar biosynthesis anti-sigma factor FlgM